MKSPFEIQNRQSRRHRNKYDLCWLIHNHTYFDGDYIDNSKSLRDLSIKRQIKEPMCHRIGSFAGTV